MVKGIIVALLAAVASIVNLSVGMGDLRVSLGIIVFIIALYFDKNMKPIPSAVITGIAVFLMRIILAAISGNVVTSLFVSYLLEVLFYLGYGIIFEFIVRRDRIEDNNPLILLLMICDFGGNSLELLARYFLMGDDFQSLTLQNLFLAAFVRSAIIWLVIKIMEKSKKQVTA